MRWIILVPWLTAGLVLTTSGCQSSPATCRGGRNAYVSSAVESLPGGQVPDSYCVCAAPPGQFVEFIQTRHERRPARKPAATLAHWQVAAELRPVLAPVMGVGAEYGWLVGYLSHDEDRDHWSVRYADPGQSDRYGGILELIQTGPMTGFQSGQMVRVEGDLVDPLPLEVKPAYRVRSLQLVQR